MGHSKFKLFKGKYASLDTLTTKIESYISTKKVSARSIGIEFLERSKEVIISVGYRSKGKHKPVSISSVNIGKVDLEDLSAIQKQMSAAAKAKKGVICHELCITDKDELVILFMSAK